jgi:hypothetical protein
MVHFNSFQIYRLEAATELITTLLQKIDVMFHLDRAFLTVFTAQLMRKQLTNLKENIARFLANPSRWDMHEIEQTIARGYREFPDFISVSPKTSEIYRETQAIIDHLDVFLRILRDPSIVRANPVAVSPVQGISNIVPPAPAAAGPGLPASSAEGSLIGVLPDPSPAIPQSRRRRRSSSPASYRDVIAFVSVDDDDVQVVGGAVGMAGGFTREEHDQADLMLTLFLASPAFEAFVNRQIGYIQGGAPQDSRENLIEHLQIMRNIFLDTHRRQYTDRVVNLALDTTLDANNLWENFQEILLHATRQTRPRLTGIHPSLRNDGLGDGGSGDGSGGSGGASGGSGGRWVGGGDYRDNKFSW